MGSGARHAWSARPPTSTALGSHGLGRGGPRRALARRSAPHARCREADAAERRVAELAAQGLANKEIAQALVVTVSTVEFHLSKTYAKLGIRSRAQLASRLATGKPLEGGP